MTDSPSTPHDALFRAIFENPDALRGELASIPVAPLAIHGGHLTRVRMGEPEEDLMITARDIWLSSLTPEWRKEVEEEAQERGLELGREEGLQQGRNEGREEGREEGLLAGQRLALVALLEAKFGVLDPARRTAIETATLEALRRWLPRVLHATRVEDVLGD